MPLGKVRLAPESKRALDDIAERAARSGTVLGAILDGTVGRLGHDAQARWPVLTGRSRAGIEWGLEGPGDAVRAFVKNDVPYSGLVRDATSGRNVWAQLVVGPAEETDIVEIADELEQFLIGG